MGGRPVWGRGFLVFASIVAALIFAPLSLGDSVWSDAGYHWKAHAPFTISLDNHTGATWTARLRQAATDWSAAAAVDVAVGGQGKVDVYDGYYGSATACAEADYDLTGQGQVKHVTIFLNDSCLDGFTETMKQYALCQEVGHALGLGDHRLDTPLTPSCMAPLNPGPSPNQNDFDQLALIYG
jgi:hypothetical protein